MCGKVDLCATKLHPTVGHNRAIVFCSSEDAKQISMCALLN
jgi:hypothetical protein